MGCDYEIVRIEPEASEVTIRDLNLGRCSITNDAETVVADLREKDILRDGWRLFYYDSNNDLDEIVWKPDGSIRFSPGPRENFG